MSRAIASSKGQITIPVKLRRKYALESGDQVHVIDYGGILTLIPCWKNPIQNAIGILKGPSSLSQILLAEHAQEISREQEGRQLY